ncbi:dihydrolipoamide dehydrogenase [Thioclava dalianensis]|uniref:Dihydrolipoamide dehydrogenase n=1 Tax=Thioclava dalianensis TaxID=1185766 RepID=A0A074U856_9RHOB|nr:dihydrolipoyl dehydrogenase [Thioclava dalianensis]KEP70857.1 dihydrolipoamide dehydrogenase [Thioclava dalianensis]SFN12544.1 dihydrolipoamide dehydrogenase [Thioclava dalianensis]
MTQHHRVIIIGSGSAGLSALHEVRRETDDFLLINHADWGTTCAARGCMPSKALIEAANAFARRRDFAQFGINGAQDLDVDIPTVLQRVRRLRDDFTSSPRAVPEELGPRAISGWARLTGPDRVEIEGHGTHSADAIILATGSTPVVPDPWRAFGNRILTTDTLFELPDLPRRIAVIGMGAIGVELAQAMARLGIEVAGFDQRDQMGGLSDPEVAAALHAGIAKDMRLYLGGQAQIEEAGAHLRVSSEQGAFEADAVLAALGRKPNIDGLGLETLGVPLDDKGLPEVDTNTLRIGETSVFLVGDANGARSLLHEASDEGYIAARNALSTSPHGMKRRVPLAITFCSPNAARIGKGFSALEGQDYLIGARDFSDQGRARMAETAQGLIRIYAAPETGRLLGAELAAPEGEHLAHLLALAMHQEMDVRAMLRMPFYHPVLEEGLRSALREIARQLPGPRQSDLADCPKTGHPALD